MSHEFKGRTRQRVDAEPGRRPAGSRPEPGPALGPGPEPRQPVHGFAGGMGLLFLLAGVGGFVPGLTRNYGELKFATGGRRHDPRTEDGADRPPVTGVPSPP